MSFEDFEMLSLAIEPLEAQESLVQITASAYSQLKDKTRKDIHRDLMKRSRPKLEDEEKKVESTADLARKMSRMINGG